MFFGKVVKNEGMGKSLSIRSKILAIIFIFFYFNIMTLTFYSLVTTENYSLLHTEEVSKTIAFESERVEKVITEMERNAVDIALAGYQFYKSDERSNEKGELIVVKNFNAFQTAVGGGIWFEPYAISDELQRLCFYAFFDPSIGAVRYDPNFQSDKYDYHTQIWYEEIAKGLSGNNGETGDTIWTVPYYDASGSFSLMTTVGAGIYDDDGNFIGLSTVDWGIQDMIDRLSAIKPTENSFVVLASLSEDYIIFNTYESGNKYVGATLSNLPWFDELTLIDDGVGVGNFSQGEVEYISFSRVIDNGWLLSIQTPSHEMYAEIKLRNIQFLIVFGISFVMQLLLVFFLVSHFVNQPLRRLTTDVTELGKGNLDKQIEINTNDEIGTLALAFNRMTVDLKELIEQSARERAEKERIGTELNIARQIQASMLPCIFPPFPERNEFDIYATMLPAKEVGGDFYDFFLIDDNTIVVVIADVSGKGVPAALFMVIAKTLIKNNAQYGKSPEDVFRIVNDLLCENNDAGMFVTAFMGYLDIPSGKFTFVNAGHNPPLLRSGAHYDWLKTKAGFVLAGMEDILYRSDEITLQAGDELFLYTDGVTEAANKEYELFGKHRLLEAANLNNDLPLDEFTKSIKSKIDIFVDGANQADDITILTLRYRGYPI